jgi:large subunit ribosomal protein L34
LTGLAYLATIRRSETSFSLHSIYFQENAVAKMTFQPHNARRSKKHGFLKRMSSQGGRKVIKSRRLKGRKKLTA